MRENSLNYKRKETARPVKVTLSEEKESDENATPITDSEESGT